MWDYTCRRWDVEQADEYLRELQPAIELAAVNLRIGQGCEEIRPSYRELAAGSQILDYRVVPDGVVDVVRVLHQRMDVDRRL
ncbi:MAG: type II toxin-antitoxin system RelE/ParE family toxin [Mycobacterium sp.]|nr:MAG: type II toxin-antitoxin system RelE/ParE family toxin [Mycobacterium sp.]